VSRPGTPGLPADSIHLKEPSPNPRSPDPDFRWVHHTAPPPDGSQEPARSPRVAALRRKAPTDNGSCDSKGAHASTLPSPTACWAFPRSGSAKAHFRKRSAPEANDRTETRTPPDDCVSAPVPFPTSPPYPYPQKRSSRRSPGPTRPKCEVR